MRVIKNGVPKIIPAKFEPVWKICDFLESKKARLSPKERYDLIQALIQYIFRISEPVEYQRKIAKEVVMSSSEVRILKVNKHGSSTDWRIIADGVMLRVDAEDVSDCPEEFLEVKYEF